ncbi:MAG: hypothetical protein ACRECV_08610 [Xanthobacteraceae bacterium]
MKSKPTRINEHVRYREQSEIFERLYPRVERLLERFGRPDYVPGQPHGDFSVHGDYSGYPQVVVFVGNLKMLQSNIVDELQQLIKKFPGWGIEVTVAVRGHYDDWPNMGLYISPQESSTVCNENIFQRSFRISPIRALDVGPRTIK